MTPTAGPSHVAPLGMLEGQPSSPGRGRGAGDSGRCGAILQGALPAAPSVPWIAKQLPRELLAPAAIGLAVGLKGVGGAGSIALERSAGPARCVRLARRAARKGVLTSIFQVVPAPHFASRCANSEFSFSTIQATVQRAALCWLNQSRRSLLV